MYHARPSKILYKNDRNIVPTSWSIPHDRLQEILCYSAFASCTVFLAQAALHYWNDRMTSTSLRPGFHETPQINSAHWLVYGSGWFFYCFSIEFLLSSLSAQKLLYADVNYPKNGSWLVTCHRKLIYSFLFSQVDHRFTLFLMSGLQSKKKVCPKRHNNASRSTHEFCSVRNQLFVIRSSEAGETFSFVIASARFCFVELQTL